MQQRKKLRNIFTNSLCSPLGANETKVLIIKHVRFCGKSKKCLRTRRIRLYF